MGTGDKVRMAIKKQHGGGEMGWPTVRKWAGAGGKRGTLEYTLTA
jgi:hypothetical protein